MHCTKRGRPRRARASRGRLTVSISAARLVDPVLRKAICRRCDQAGSARRNAAMRSYGVGPVAADAGHASVDSLAAMPSRIPSRPPTPASLPARPDLADIRLRGRVEAARYVEGEPRARRRPSAPLRRTPRPDAGLDTEAQMGDPVTLYEAGKASPSSSSGPTAMSAICRARRSARPIRRRPTGSSALRTFAYPAPDLKQPILGHLGLGAAVARREETVAAALVDGIGVRGFVFADHCAPIDRTEPDFAGTAERLVGTPYLWGGRTSLGLDCSGLVQLCLAPPASPPRATPTSRRRRSGDALPLDLSAACGGATSCSGAAMSG